MSAPAACEVLLIDDDDAVVRAMSRLLSRRGLAVATSNTVGDALARLDAGLSPRVVVCDYRMPDGDGVALLRQVRERWPRVQRILMTAMVDADAVAAAVNDAKVTRFLSKPWDEGGFLAAIESALEQWLVEDENVRLNELARAQNERLQEANRDLEARIAERTLTIGRAKREWEVAFDALSEPLMLIDAGYRVLRANVAFAQHLGGEVKDLPGELCHELRSRSQYRLERDPDGVCRGCPTRRASTLGAPASAELETSSEKTYSLGVFPIAGDDRGAMVCSYRDLTAQRAQARQLAQADKLAAMGLLAGGVAHEINNPLGAILAFSQLLRREQMDAAEQAEYLQEIEDSALRCKQIVERLLRFARQGRREDRRPFSMNDVVAETAFLVEKSVLGHDVKLFKELDPDLWTAMGNPNEIGQVLLNLVTNARDALGRGGTVTVRTRNVPEADGVELTVSDDGPGIPPEIQQRIFDPFFTTKPEGKGTGLGLAVSYGIVRDHHGRIHVKSRLGEGTEFVVFLPRAA